MSMEVQTANNHINNAIRTQTKSTPSKTSSVKTSLLSTSQLQSSHLRSDIIDQRSNSPTSSSSENEKEQIDLDLNSSNSLVINNSSNLIGAELSSKSNGSLSGASTSSTGINVNVENSNTSFNSNNTSVGQIKKRISSSRTPTRKARRIKFYRNGDRFYPGMTIPVSNERYRSFESLFEDLTRHLEENVKIPGAVRTIYTMCGRKICTLDELEDGQSYVCSCNNESFKKVEYNTTSTPLANLSLSNKSSTRFSKVIRPSSPSKNGGLNSITNSMTSTNGSSALLRLSESNSVVYPRIVTLIRNGTKPRKIMRLLLNKRNSPTFDHVLTAITQKVKLDTGYVRKVFTLSGSPVLQLADFFSADDIFFAYGTERVNNPDDFRLEPDEQKAMNALRKTHRTANTTYKGPKPKMPIKSKNIRDVPINEEKVNDPSAEALNELGIKTSDLPAPIRERYRLGQLIGDGNFAVVLRVKDRITGLPYALKIIDKSKCKGKEHYIDAEVRVMKKLEHPQIISLILDVDQTAYMYLVLEYVSGGDLFDTITRVTRFSEDQSRVMIKHLASAMAYLHSMGIVHRDIKPENLLVELDEAGNVIELKLADFGLACEVTEPLFAVCGTPTYVAPEILMETGYGLKIDVWAAGIILYILLCGFPPFISPDNQQEPLFDAIINGVYEFPDPYWSDIGDGVRDLIGNMLQSDPDVRFTSEDILDHYWTLNECGEYIGS